jgi:hypothetical protein
VVFYTSVTGNGTILAHKADKKASDVVPLAPRSLLCADRASLTGILKK